jgi:soluble lytic murein transglycosylase-like protein
MHFIPAKAAALAAALCLSGAALAAEALDERIPELDEYKLIDPGQYQVVDGDDAYRYGGRPAVSAAVEAPIVPTPPMAAVVISEAPAAIPFPARATRYERMIEASARAYGLEPDLVHAVIAAESAYDPLALSPKGAQGLMQLMPATALRYAISDLQQPRQNIAAGTRHLRYLMNMFQDDLRLVLAAYNAGEQAVRKYADQVPPYPETQAYVKRVLAFYRSRVAVRDKLLAK